MFVTCNIISLYDHPSLKDQPTLGSKYQICIRVKKKLFGFFLKIKCILSIWTYQPLPRIWTSDPRKLNWQYNDAFSFSQTCIRVEKTYFSKLSGYFLWIWTLSSMDHWYMDSISILTFSPLCVGIEKKIFENCQFLADATYQKWLKSAY